MGQAKEAHTLGMEGRKVVIASPTRLLIPAAGVTRLDFVNDYLAVADGASHVPSRLHPKHESART